ncbi:hypothetical protein [Demequina litorisediminis]|uniref:Endonuclease/Exonuclease/phosphatase family protein n=1 Tax=Demequina litorisediminis TaxID=1849022 RepID=A0ABQ6IFS1_9MICO|nr:hypothetical protein [Demequina litorisediminis]GMA36730.1 hypothetical protein GCM10025876_29340 [Demequina litorisediminis]
MSLGEDYSYVFDGQWGSLDYAFASASMSAQVTGAEHVHINADEPSVLDYNTDFKSASQIESLYAPDMYRTSDHDPALIGLSLGDGETPAETTTVQVLGTNDFHGRILPNFASGEAGAAVMAGAVDQAPVRGPQLGIRRGWRPHWRLVLRELRGTGQAHHRRAERHGPRRVRGG